MRRMLTIAVLGLVAAVGLAGATALRGGLGDLLDQVKNRVGSALLAHDVLVEPGKDVTLEASLRSGLRLTGVGGKRLQFRLDGESLGELVSDRDGNVSLPWKAPAKPGDYVLTVRVKPEDQPEKPVDDAQLLVAVRAPDTRMVVVDLDKTVVGSGFAWVLLGGAKPMDGASVVMQRLAADHTIVYLTHRPDFLGPSSKRWLVDNGFPSGPVLTSTMEGLVGGSGTYKTARLASIKKTFKNLAVGIGDKVSDAQAYVDHGLRSILILPVDWSEDDPEDYEKAAADLATLPDSVQVVTNWSEVADVLFKQRTFPKQDMEKRLRDVARDLRRRGKD